MSHKSKLSIFPLLLISTIFTVLLSLTLLLFNLKIVVTPRFIQARFREANLYQPAVEQLRGVWLRDLEINGGSNLEKALAKAFKAEWLQEEVERNLNELGEYLSGKKTDLTLNLELGLVREEVIAQLSIEDEGKLEEIKQNLPERVDLLGQAGLLGEEGSRQLYQLKMTVEAINLSLKILVFVLFFSLICFFLLRPIEVAGRWVGLTLLTAGLLLTLIVFILRILVVVKLVPFLAGQLTFAPEMIELGTRLIDKSLQTYLSLIQWQSIFVFVFGLLIILLTLVFKEKE